MNRLKLPLALAAVAIVAAGCGRSDNDDAVPAAAAAVAPASTAAPTTTPAPPAAAATEVAAKAGDSQLGELLTDTDGLTLYGFTNDVDAISTCYGTCAEAWPPVIVDENWTVGPGLDTGIFATTERDDGTLQLVAGKYPLYTFGGDAAPGDVTGHGSGEVWYAVGLDGALLAGDAAADDAVATTTGDGYGDGYGEAAVETTAAPEPAALASVASSELGDIVVDEGGMTLYGFTKDADGTPTCEGACADAWPPLTVESEELPEGLDPAVFSVVHRPDDTHQLKAGKWPLYRFAGDAAPGETNGQGSGGVWFVVDPAGGLIKNAG
jgi:predicted lipoprotein with Yx(FWY)xxD motif